MKWAMVAVVALAAAGCRRPDSQRPSAFELAREEDAAWEDGGTVTSIGGEGTVEGEATARKPPAVRSRQGGGAKAVAADSGGRVPGPSEGSDGDRKADAELAAFIEKAARQDPFDEPLELPDHLIERK